MTKDFGFCDSTCLIVGRVAEVKKKFTLDSGRIHDCVLLDRNVEVCSHKYTWRGIYVLGNVFEGGFLQHWPRKLLKLNRNFVDNR